MGIVPKNRPAAALNYRPAPRPGDRGRSLTRSSAPSVLPLPGTCPPAPASPRAQAAWRALLTARKREARSPTCRGGGFQITSSITRRTAAGAGLPGSRGGLFAHKYKSLWSLPRTKRHGTEGMATRTKGQYGFKAARADERTCSAARTPSLRRVPPLGAATSGAHPRR